MESKYLTFEDVSLQVDPKGLKKTKDFRVWNKTKTELLGFINWRSGWRRYVFTSPTNQCSFDIDCLNDIQRFLKLLMIERENRLEKEN